MVASDKSFPLVALLGLPVANSQKKEALSYINGFFSGIVSEHDSLLVFFLSFIAVETISVENSHRRDSDEHSINPVECI